MIQKQVPLLTTTVRQFRDLEPGSLEDYRARMMTAAWNNDLPEALCLFRKALCECGPLPERAKRAELEFFIEFLNSLVRTKPRALDGILEECVDNHLRRLHNPRYVHHRSAFNDKVKGAVRDSHEFMFMAGMCFGELKALLYSGKEITDTALALIEEAMLE